MMSSTFSVEKASQKFFVNQKLIFDERICQKKNKFIVNYQLYEIHLLI